MTYKLIALDIDGTIRSVETPLSERTRLAVARTVELGAKVTVVTGRMFHAAVAATTELDLNTPIVSYQGAHVADPLTADVLWHRPMTPAMATNALEALEGWDREIVLYHDDEVYVNRLTPWIEGYRERNGTVVHVVSDLKSVAMAGPTRIAVSGEVDNVTALDARLRSEFDSKLQITHSLPHLCEILHPETGKDIALVWLCEHLGIRRHEVAAFGNGTEDAAMLRWAGLGVAVEDGESDLIAAADVVAPPLAEDGVAKILEDLAVKGRLG